MILARFSPVEDNNLPSVAVKHIALWRMKKGGDGSSNLPRAIIQRF